MLGKWDAPAILSHAWGDGEMKMEWHPALVLFWLLSPLGGIMAACNPYGIFWRLWLWEVFRETGDCISKCHMPKDYAYCMNLWTPGSYKNSLQWLNSLKRFCFVYALMLFFSLLDGVHALKKF